MLSQIIGYYHNNMIRNEYYIDNEQKKQGLYKEYTYDGILYVECLFKDNLLNGIYKQYHPNGNIWIQSNYKNGLRHGDYIEYNPKGIEIYRMSFQENKQIHFINDILHEYIKQAPTLVL